MNKKIKEELKRSFNPPNLNIEKKKIFLSEINYPTESLFEVFFVQVQYISKKFWILSIFIMALITGVIQKNKDIYDTLLLISCLLTFFVIISVGEISKSISYNMQELEMSCKYNLEKLTLIQMTIIGSFHFVILLILMIIFGNISGFGFIRTTLYCIMPYMIVNYTSLFILNHIKVKENLYICNAVVFFTSIILFILNIYEINKFLFSNTTLLLLGFIMFFILIIKEIILLTKERGDLQCYLKLID